MKPIILALLISQTGEGVPASVVQAKIDQAAPNAVIELPAGTINGSLLIERPLILRGQGETKTVLRGNRDGPVVTIRVPTKDEVKLEHLEITNGGWDMKSALRMPLTSGGVYIQGAAHVVIDHALIRRNYVASMGGAIDLSGGSLTIRDSEIRENVAHFDGAIAGYMGTSLDIERTIIAGNRAGSNGGIGFCGKTLRLQDVAFEDNLVDQNGGAHLTLDIKETSSMSVLLDGVRFSSTSKRAVFVRGPVKVRLRNTTWPSDQELPPGAEILPD